MKLKKEPKPPKRVSYNISVSIDDGLKFSEILKWIKEHSLKIEEMYFVVERNYDDSPYVKLNGKKLEDEKYYNEKLLKHQKNKEEYDKWYSENKDEIEKYKQEQKEKRENAKKDQVKIELAKVEKQLAMLNKLRVKLRG